MRTQIIAGNWKMFNDLAATRDLINGLKSRSNEWSGSVTVIVCPPFTSLETAATTLKGSSIRLGAQNMSEHDEGAYTGEISWKMLLGTSCEYVILGHSERRQYFKEADDLINRKARKAIAHGLKPIVCVGETLQEREGGTTARVIATQVNGVLAGMSAEEMQSVIIAYEPVWAIGTGKNATPAQAQEVHAQIRGLVGKLFSATIAEGVRIQYGGSVKPENGKELLSQPDIDGALVGGACLKADSFAAIIKSAK
jgi:triosephosphate isomerase (TIM)